LKGGKMKGVFVALLAAVFAFIPLAYAQEYQEITETGGEPETRLTVKVPTEVSPDEEFTIEATLQTTEEGKEYRGKLNACILTIYEPEKMGAPGEDIKGLLSELEPEEIEEAGRTGEPIELDKYYIEVRCADSERVKVTNEEQTIELALLAPSTPPKPGLVMTSSTLNFDVRNLEAHNKITVKIRDVLLKMV